MLSVEKHLRHTIDDHLMIKTWTEVSRTPLYLRELYKFYEMSILDMICILLEVLGPIPDIDTIKKHVKRIGELTDRPVVFMYKSLSRYRRRSLIINRIPFLLEDGQMYLPFLGLSLGKVPEIVEEAEHSIFSPSTQLAYLFFLYNRDTVVNTTALATLLNVTPMTASRALQNLLEAGLVTYETGGKTGRSKEYRRIDDPLYFQKGTVLLSSPVKKIVYIKDVADVTLISGLDALASLSIINFPGHRVRAIGQDFLAESGLEIVYDRAYAQDEKLVELEIWTYNPWIFSTDGHVDLLSLYLSLKVLNDERVDQALIEILGRTSWYMD